MFMVDHITINVIDMGKSLLFYEQGLGLLKQERVDMGDHILEYFKISSTTRLELIEYLTPTPGYKIQCDTQGSYRHLALATEDIKRFEEHIKQFIETTGYGRVKTEVAPCDKLSFYNMLLIDPNGLEIEVIQRYN